MWFAVRYLRFPAQLLIISDTVANSTSVWLSETSRGTITSRGGTKLRLSSKGQVTLAVFWFFCLRGNRRLKLPTYPFSMIMLWTWWVFTCTHTNSWDEKSILVIRTLATINNVTVRICVQSHYSPFSDFHILSTKDCWFPLVSGIRRANCCPESGSVWFQSACNDMWNGHCVQCRDWSDSADRPATKPIVVPLR